MRGLGVDIFIDLRNTSYTTTAQVEIDANGKGVIICQGGRFGGLTFYLKDGKPAFCYNFLGLESTTIVAPTALKPGKHTLVYNFTYDGGGIDKGGNMTISVDGNQVAEGKLVLSNKAFFLLMIWLMLA